MPQLSPMEILVIVMVALIVFGPEKLPQIARQIGRAANELRRMASEVKDEFQEGLDLGLDDPPEPRPDHPNVRNRREGMPPALEAGPDDEDEPEDDVGGDAAPDPTGAAAEDLLPEDNEPDEPEPGAG